MSKNDIEAEFDQLDLLAPSKLNLCLDNHRLAQLVGTDYQGLGKLIFPDQVKKYRSFTIPKKSGGEREILAPAYPLKEIQRILSKEFAALYPARSSAHGFIHKKSIVSNAERHVGRRFVLNLDLKDFFSSIHFGRLRKLFQKPPFELPENVATVLANICCYQGVLPQGAPTSPVLTNIICYKLDSQLKALAVKNNARYTRYADDITFSFSCSAKKLPKSIVANWDGSDVELGGRLLKIIEDNGFTVNPTKTRMKPKSQCQRVTGIVVNEKLNVNKRYLKRLKSIIYSIETHGLEKSAEHFFTIHSGKPDLKVIVDRSIAMAFENIVRGKLAFLKMVRGDGDAVFRRLQFRFEAALGRPDYSFFDMSLDEAKKSVFFIENESDGMQGTGFLLDNYGLITNEHVVSGIDHPNILDPQVFRAQSRTPMHVVGQWKSQAFDVAVLEPSAQFEAFHRFSIGDYSQVKIGDEICLLGYPEHNPEDSVRVTAGNITQKAMRNGVTYWVTDAQIIAGNSGGPVLDKNMKVIGIATMGAESGDKVARNNLILPISYLQHAIDTDV